MADELAMVTAEHAFLRRDAGTDQGENESGTKMRFFLDG